MVFITPSNSLAHGADGQEVCKGCQEIYCCGCGLAKAPKMFSIRARNHYFGKSSQQVTCSECTEKGINARIGGFRKDAKCSECTKEFANKMFRRIKGQRQTKQTRVRMVDNQEDFPEIM